jgi:hypothetical protein
MREAFATDEYQILLVANKFQTGYDQPLLCGMYVDKRLAGIQAVQTLSRLNRAHPGKDMTYILDFVNDPEEVLGAFKTYFETAELAGVTDPNLVLDLKARLDAAGHYDEFEVERVVKVELDPHATQSQLSAAIEPVADRLLKRYKAAQAALEVAQARSDAKGEKDAQDELEALQLFKRNLGAYLRVYTFLSQIFDYGNTAVEKRAIFFKRLLPLLEFGRERDEVDLSKVVLTHHRLKDLGQRKLALTAEDAAKLQPMTETGGGQVRDPEKVLPGEIIEKVNTLFEGELTDDDKLVYVNNVLKGKLLESETLRQQAANNSKQQFANSPDLSNELLNAITDAPAAHRTMSQQALGSEKVRDGLKDILLGPGQLYEALRLQRLGPEAARPVSGRVADRVGAHGVVAPLHRGAAARGAQGQDDQSGAGHDSAHPERGHLGVDRRAQPHLARRRSEDQAAEGGRRGGALSAVVGGAGRAAARAAAAPRADGALQGQHRVSESGSVRVALGVGGAGARARDERLHRSWQARQERRGPVGRVEPGGALGHRGRARGASRIRLRVPGAADRHDAQHGVAVGAAARGPAAGAGARFEAHVRQALEGGGRELRGPPGPARASVGAHHHPLLRGGAVEPDRSG